MTNRTRDDLGDRMKLYEATFEHTFEQSACIYVRLDGKAFHSVTCEFDKPFDTRLHTAMCDITKKLVDMSGAVMGYTQSDEISLMLLTANEHSMHYLGGRMQKLVSILAAKATSDFLRTCPALEKEALFDCRAMAMSETEVINAFRWRTMDARRNSILGCAQQVLGKREALNKDSAKMIECLKDAGLDWFELPLQQRFGTAVRYKIEERVLMSAEIDALPERHAARKNPELVVRRRILYTEPVTGVAYWRMPDDSRNCQVRVEE